MNDETKMKQARLAYETLCAMLDDKDWHYEKDDEHLCINSGAQGEDLKIDLHIEVDSDRELVTLLSIMPFSIPESKRNALAIAVSAANFRLVDGCFDYDYLEGSICFRMTSSFRDSLVGKALFEYMLMCSCFTVDEYNDKFLVVAARDMSYGEIPDFIEGGNKK